MARARDKIVKTLTALSDPTTFLYTLSDHYANKTLTTAMSILFITSVYAGLLAFHNSASRYFFAAGREGLLPKRSAVPIGSTKVRTSARFCKRRWPLAWCWCSSWRTPIRF